MTRRAGLPTLLTVLSLLLPGAAHGQGVVPATLGAAAGFVGGGLVSVGIVTARARADDYIFSTADALGWNTAAIPLGTLAGLTLGLVDSDRLGRASLGGLAGAVVGTGVGILVGDRVWSPPEGRWAGGIIGGAAGIVAGSIVGILWPGDDDDPRADSTAGVPLTVTLTF